MRQSSMGFGCARCDTDRADASTMSIAPGASPALATDSNAFVVIASPAAVYSKYELDFSDFWLHDAQLDRQLQLTHRQTTCKSRYALPSSAGDESRYMRRMYWNDEGIFPFMKHCCPMNWRCHHSASAISDWPPR